MRNPLEVYLLGLCVVSGAANLVAPAPLPSHIPAVVTVAWYWLLIVGGVVALAGLAWPDPLTGALVNRSGLLMVGAGAYAYAVAVGYPLTGRALFGAGVLIGFGVCAHLRCVQISRTFRVLRRGRDVE